MEAGDKRKDCCKQETNLGKVEQVRPDLVFRRCQVCNCRHLELTVDPLKMGVRVLDC